jgi:hypothetical protein
LSGKTENQNRHITLLTRKPFLTIDYSRLGSLSLPEAAFPDADMQKKPAAKTSRKQRHKV